MNPWRECGKVSENFENKSRVLLESGILTLDEKHVELALTNRQITSKLRTILVQKKIVTIES